MPLDLSWLSTGMPILGFVFVFVLLYAILTKVKVIGDSRAMNVIISLILSIILVSFSSIRSYITNLAPWFAVILVLAFFLFMIAAFLIKDPAGFTKVFAFIFIIGFAVIAIVTLFYTFEGTHAYILPGANEEGTNEFLLGAKHFILGEQFLSGLLIFIIAIIVIFIIV